MPRKKEKTTMDDMDLRLVKAWIDFRQKVNDFINNVEECTVELHFESSLDSRTHFQFEPGESVFISDIQVSNNNQVIFQVPHGAKTKTFNIQESELINAKMDGNTETLNSFLMGMYKESFKDVPEAATPTILERKYLATNAELRDLLNNAEDAMKQYELNIERGQTYSKLDDYGMF